jgi:hypothetical protein
MNPTISNIQSYNAATKACLPFFFFSFLFFFPRQEG